MATRQAIPNAAFLEAPVTEDPAAAPSQPAAGGTELPLDADPPETRREPVRLDRVVERLLKRLGVEASPWLEQLADAWPSLLPVELAKATRPGKWDGHILYVYVANSMRLYEIRRQHLPVIERAVRQFAGDARVRAVRLTIDPG
jgi:hypothetical protein